MSPQSTPRPTSTGRACCARAANPNGKNCSAPAQGEWTKDDRQLTEDLRDQLAKESPDRGLVAELAKKLDGQISLSVSDTGLGIPPDHVTRIFDPFFTTKEVGRGTGLGLAVCYGIVTDHGGRLDVQSVVNAGTTFTISLPTAAVAEKSGD